MQRTPSGHVKLLLCLWLLVFAAVTGHANAWLGTRIVEPSVHPSARITLISPTAFAVSKEKAVYGYDASTELHKYLYAQDDPVNLSDPSGLDPWGHHLVPRKLWQNCSQRVQNVFNRIENRLDVKDYVLHNSKPYNNISRDDYTAAVKEKLTQFINGKGKTSIEQLSDKELQEFAGEIKATRSGTIGKYNAGVAEEILESASEGLEAEEVLELTEIAVFVDEDVLVVDVGVGVGLGL